MFVDSHCHIEDEEIIKRAFSSNVTTLLNAGKDLDEIAYQLELSNKYPSIYTSVGVHPDSAKEKLNKITTEDIINLSSHPKVIAIGECGLDYHYGSDIKEEQKEMFSYHIKAAALTKLPLMIHQREAELDTLALLKDGIKKYGKLTGVIHCFTSSQEFADEILNLGFYLSASGIITFKTGASILEVFKNCPLDKILIETDTPYLAPVPYRGKTNEPAYIIKTAQKLAEAKNLSLNEIANITKNNFFSLYQKAIKQERS
jgi:TatD DNase family protein